MCLDNCYTTEPGSAFVVLKFIPRNSLLMFQAEVHNTTGNNLLIGRALLIRAGKQCAAPHTAAVANCLGNVQGCQCYANIPAPRPADPPQNWWLLWSLSQNLKWTWFYLPKWVAGLAKGESVKEGQGKPRRDPLLIPCPLP